MATIKEDYCSKEIYRLLIEKGFDGEVHTTFDDEGYTQPSVSLQMAMKWLRKVHGLHISVDVCPIYGKVKDEEGRNTCGLLYWHYMASGEWINDKYNPRRKAFVVSEKSYKKAIEAALKHCLENLI